MKHFNKIVLSLVILLLAQFLFIQQTFAQISATKPTVNIIATLPSTLKSGDTFTTYYTLGGSPTYVEYYFSGPENIASAQSPRRSNNVANNFSASMSDIYGKTVRDGFYVMYLRACNTAGCSNFFGSSIEVNANAVPIVPTNPVFSTTTPPISYKQPTFSAGNDLELVLPDNRIAPSGQFATAGTQGIDTINWRFVSYPKKLSTAPRITNAHTIKPTFSGLTEAGTYLVELSVEDRINNLFVDRMNIVVLAEGTQSPVSPNPTQPIPQLPVTTDPEAVKKTPKISITNSSVTVNDFMTIAWTTPADIDSLEYYVTGPTPIGSATKPGTIPATRSGEIKVRPIDVTGNRNMLPGTYTLYVRGAMVGEQSSPYVSATFVVVQSQAQLLGDLTVKLQSSPAVLRSNDNLYVNYGVTGSADRIEYYIDGPLKLGEPLRPVASTNLFGPLTITPTAIFSTVAPDGVYYAFMRACKGTVCGRFARTTFVVSATALPTLPTPTPMLPPNQQPPIVPPTPMLPPNTSPVMALAQYILNLTAFYQSLAAYEKNPVGTRPTPPPAPAF